MVLQVQGQRVACDAATLAHLKAVQLFLDDNSTEQDAAEMLFQLPEWVTLELWERVAAFPGLKVPEGTEALLTYSACRSYLKQHWQHLTDIMQLSDFLGVDQLTELCTSALLVHLRELLRKHMLVGKPIPKPELKAALMQPISTESLKLLLTPIIFDDEHNAAQVLPVHPDSFRTLLDGVYEARLVPPAGVVHGLLRARFWPCLSKERFVVESVSGIPNGGREKVYLRMGLPLPVLEQHQVLAVLCKVRSHDQGWGGEPSHRNTYNGSYTFGKLSVCGKAQSERLYTNLTAVQRFQMHTAALTADSEIVSMIGDAVSEHARRGGDAVRNGSDGGGGEDTARMARGAAPLAGHSGGDDTARVAGGVVPRAGPSSGSRLADTAAAGTQSKSSSQTGASDSTPCIDIALVMYAFYPGWENTVSEASLQCFMYPKAAGVPTALCLPPSEAELAQEAAEAEAERAAAAGAASGCAVARVFTGQDSGSGAEPSTAANKTSITGCSVM